MSRKPLGAKLRFEVLKRDGFRCVYCGARAPEARLVIDHRVPVALGGASTIDNLATACFMCNAGKAAVPIASHPPDPKAVADVVRQRHAEGRCGKCGCRLSQVSHWRPKRGSRPAFTLGMCGRKCGSVYRVSSAGQIIGSAKKGER